MKKRQISIKQQEYHICFFRLIVFLLISIFVLPFQGHALAASLSGNIDYARNFAEMKNAKRIYEPFLGKKDSDKLIKAEAGVVIDVDSGAVLFGKNMDKAYPPASITKLLTALIVIENSDLNDTVLFTESAMSNVESDSGNKFDMAEGDMMSVKDALHLLLLRSSNQAANALAERVAGSNEAFVEMMNQKIAALGCTASHFDNPSGLNGDTQYVSARDMAMISRAAFSNSELLKISSTLKYKMPATINNPKPFIISTEHRMLKKEETSYFYAPAKAGKTGYLIKAGNTLVTYAEKGGKKLISVILKGSPYQYFLDGRALLKFGFANFDNFNVAEQESDYVTGETSVEIGGKTYLPSDLEIDQAGAAIVPKGGKFSNLKHSLVTEMPEEHPERSVAFIQYTYHGKKAGGAYLKTKEVSNFEKQPESSKVKPEKQAGKEEKEEEKEKGFPISPVWLILLLALAALGGGGAYLYHSGKKDKIFNVLL